MAETLVIRLLHPGAGAEAEWLVVDSGGARLGNVAAGMLGEAAALAAGRNVTVLVPGTDVLLAQPELPVKSGAKLAQVVPFALEEQLASDVEDMHFAVGRRAGHAGTPVAAVAHGTMRAWMQALGAAGIVPSALCAESAAVPLTPGGLSLLVEGLRIHVRRPGTPPAVVEADPLIEGLQLALASGTLAREHVTLYVTTADYERDREMIEGLREFTASLQVKLLGDGPLPLLALTAAQEPATNLLQGPYAVSSPLRARLAPWRHAAMLAGALLVVHVAVKAVEFRRLGAEEAALDAEISALFAQALPGARQQDARAQVEARLAQLRGGGTGGGLMAGLGLLGEAMAEAPDTTVEALSWRANVLDLRVLAPSVESLDRIQSAASQRGMAAEIQSATPRESRVEGRLQLRSPGA